MLSECELAEARATISRALDEDLRYGPDVTTLATVPDGATTTASLITREPGVIAGVDVALLVLDEVLGADGYAVLDRVEAGARLQPGASALTVEAQMLALLTAERTLLNLVCHLSGIATATAAWVDAVDGTKAEIRDTRKTLPGLRALQKYAVRVGGGVNHRMGLGDAALIKDNHVAAAGSVVGAQRGARAGFGVRGRGRLARAAGRGARRRRGTCSAGQLSGVADTDSRAAPRRPRARHETRVVGRAVPRYRGRVCGYGRGLPRRWRPHPLGARSGYWGRRLAVPAGDLTAPILPPAWQCSAVCENTPLIGCAVARPAVTMQTFRTARVRRRVSP